jgi:hypothetical protein
LLKCNAGFEALVGGQLERLHPVRLETTGVPHPLHGSRRTRRLAPWLALSIDMLVDALPVSLRSESRDKSTATAR